MVFQITPNCQSRSIKGGHEFLEAQLQIRHGHFFAQKLLEAHHAPALALAAECDLTISSGRSGAARK